MSLDTLTYLLQFDWPFVAVVLVAGTVVGWRSAGDRPEPRQGRRRR